jgi:hypothetical protein
LEASGCGLNSSYCPGTSSLEGLRKHTKTLSLRAAIDYIETHQTQYIIGAVCDRGYINRVTEAISVKKYDFEIT